MKSQIKKEYQKAKDKTKFLNDLKVWLHEELSELKQPVDLVRWVDVNKVHANDYNPNSVAREEMKLLHTSIMHDGYTQPIVTVYDKEKDQYVIVDGFHRYLTCKTSKDVRDRNKGRVPVVVIEKDINDRMASTVRHNRARGKHSVTGMSNMVFDMLDNGWSDADICNELGMESEEILRLKHITGFSKLFANREYHRSWVIKNQLKIAQNYEARKKENGDDKAVLEKPKK